MKKLLLMFLIAVSVLLTFVAVGNAQRKQPVNSSVKQVEDLWERIVEAKGGRERLYQVESLSISYEYAENSPSSELYVFPDKSWMWEDRRKTVFGLNVTSKNFQQGFWYWVVGHDVPNNAKKLKLTSKAEAEFDKPYLVYLLECKWFKPKLVKVSESRLGLRKVFLLEARVDQFRVGIHVDKDSFLPLRIGYYTRETGDDQFMWYGLDDYREVAGIMLPHSISYEGKGWVPTKIEVNVRYDPRVFERPPDLKAGPEQWRAKP